MTIPETEPQGPPELRAALDREKEKRQELEAKLATIALDQVGLDDKGRKAVDKFYDGDPTDADAITTWAEEYGFDTGPALTPPTDAPTPSASLDNKLDAVDAASSTAGIPKAVDELEDQRQTALQKAANMAATGVRDNTKEITAAVSAELGIAAEKQTP